ncbi:MAG: S-layer homology domain-containing protein [Oscillospiraceae bacterium]|nr:S-layer homology domain-containing protein [Oscillospiraceae bacterium]
MNTRKIILFVLALLMLTQTGVSVCAVSGNIFENVSESLAIETTLVLADRDGNDNSGEIGSGTVSGTMSASNKPQSPPYRFEDGKNTYTLGSGEPPTLILEKGVSGFSVLRVDGKMLSQNSHFKADGPLTRITISADYLDTLSVGRHTMTVYFIDGAVVSVTITIKSGEDETTTSSQTSKPSATPTQTASPKPTTTPTPTPTQTASATPTPTPVPAPEQSSTSDQASATNQPPAPNWTPVQRPTPEPWLNPFEDVSEGDWYYGDIEYVFLTSLMNGTTDADPVLFSPGAATTRGMIVAILYRIERIPDASSLSNPFDDVAEGQWYADAVKWAAVNGIVSGYGNDVFAPDDNITREQLATILYNFSIWKGIDVSVGENTNILSFEDAFDISEWAIPAMQWACGAGIISGKTDGYLDPAGEATRAEVAAIIHRFLMRF